MRQYLILYTKFLEIYTLIYVYVYKIFLIYSVEPNPIDGIGGQYLAGPPDGSRPGVFQVNVHHPNKSYVFLMLMLQ